MRLGLTVARLASAAWVGAATLFVVIALREVRHPGFDSATKDTLALLRFPAYYAAGVILLGTAFATALIGLAGCAKGRRRGTAVAASLLGLALLVIVADFAGIYLPLVGMILPVGRPRPPLFAAYHRASIAVNVCNLGLSALAAVILCWQNPPSDRSQAN
jgi:hypothetical protein